MDCREIEDLLPAYALNALSPDEVALVDSHVESCPWCVALVRDNLQAVAALARAAEPSVAPQALRERVLRAIPREERLRREENRPRVAFSHLALGAAASVAVVLLAASITVGVRMSGKIDDLEHENGALATRVELMAEKDEKLVEMSMEQRSISYVMASPDSRVLSLEVGESTPKAGGLLMISGQGRTAILMAYGLQPSSEAGAYQVWLRKGDEPAPMGDLWVDESEWGVLRLWADQPINLFQRLWITQQPAQEGTAVAASSSTEPVLWGSIAPE